MKCARCGHAIATRPERAYHERRYCEACVRVLRRRRAERR